MFVRIADHDRHLHPEATLLDEQPAVAVLPGSQDRTLDDCHGRLGEAQHRAGGHVAGDPLGIDPLDHYGLPVVVAAEFGPGWEDLQAPRGKMLRAVGRQGQGRVAMMTPSQRCLRCMVVAISRRLPSATADGRVVCRVWAGGPGSPSRGLTAELLLGVGGAAALSIDAQHVIPGLMRGACMVTPWGSPKATNSRSPLNGRLVLEMATWGL
ncbi:MAG: hypothetical protein NZ700_01510 [Gemmataceae bacterium]|nr:hypothetical protein [Gemmataceae bacterium]MDW8267180.1 hypothetical protein [Gemmataceae bacterium]